MTCTHKQYSFIQLRRGSDAEFTASNIILASGEPAYAIDTQILKIGDGVTPWNNLLTINTFNLDSKEPDGFVNRTDSEIDFNNSTITFTIQPKSPATKYEFYNDGIKVIKNSTENLILPSSTALYFIHFDKSTNTLSYKTTGFDFETDIPIAQIYFNATDVKTVYFGEERHGLRMDNATHEYLHNVFGTQYINGLSISNYSTGGDGSSNSDASIAIGNGLIYDEDIKVNITNSASPSNPFEQVLSPTGMIPVYYKTGSAGIWTDTTATNYPLKVGTTAQYNLNSGGNWSASDSPNPTNNRYIASWICATSQEHAPIIAIMGQRIDSSLEQAKSNSSWSDLNLNGLPITELRPLYRLIYDTKSTFTNAAKAFLVDVLDIRSHIDTITGLPQNDHGNLYGLADDDHYQYIHIDNARIINANHSFLNGLISSGIISSVSGNFINNLTVNLVPVSVSGHSHVSTDITDFASSLSGLLPLINNSGDNRILTSTGTSTGINAESNLTFDGLSINTSGSGVFTSGINIGGASVTGTITGLSSTSTVPAIRFQSITANHTNTSHVIFDWYKNLSTRLFYIDGAGSFVADTNNGNFIAPSTNPSTGNGAYIGHGMRRSTTSNGFDFAWGESITSATEPGIDLYPIGGTHIAHGILLRLSKDSAKTSTALLVNGSGNVGIGTASPSGALHVAGTGYIDGRLNVDNLRFDGNAITSINTNGDIDLTPNGTGEVNISKVDIDSGAIDGTAIGINSASTAKFTQVYPTVYSFGSTAGTVTTNVQNGQIFDITVTGATTLANPTNSIDGVTLRWRITQDITGGHAVTLDTKFNIPSSATTPLLWSTSGNFTDILAATYHSGRDKWDVVAFVPGY